MDCVEREFEKRDATIYDLEGQVKVEKGKVEHLESELQKASKIIESHRAELGAARKSQKTLVEQCEHIEGEIFLLLLSMYDNFSINKMFKIVLSILLQANLANYKNSFRLKN